ncbi:MAG: LytR/AlgR family response regulator transcription factor [Bacillota bacterium]
MLNILVVEDNRVERNNLVRMLKKLNNDIKVFEAAAGEQAIKILKQEKIGLFFLDIELPDISGLKIAETIRSILQYELTYIVFITTRVYYQLEAFKKYHCYDFIEKPYKQEDVLKLSERLIRGIKHNDSINQVVRFETKNCILKIFIKDILFIESQGKNCMIHTKNSQYVIPNM